MYQLLEPTLVSITVTLVILADQDLHVHCMATEAGQAAALQASLVWPDSTLWPRQTALSYTAL